MRRVLQGDRPLYEVLVRRYNQRLYRVARAIVRDDAEAEDVMQQVYVQGYAHLEPVRGPGAVLDLAHEDRGLRVAGPGPAPGSGSPADRGRRRRRGRSGPAAVGRARSGTAGVEGRSARPSRSRDRSHSRDLSRGVRASRGRGPQHRGDRELPGRERGRGEDADSTGRGATSGPSSSSARARPRPRRSRSTCRAATGSSPESSPASPGRRPPPPTEGPGRATD